MPVAVHVYSGKKSRVIFEMTTDKDLKQMHVPDINL
jgi:hypothetical protein